MPGVREHVFLRKIENTAHYIDSSIFELYLLSEKTSESNMTLDLSLPDRIADSIYTVKAYGRSFCVSLQSYGSSECVDSSLPSGILVSGFYTSGTEMKVSLVKENNITINIENSF